jgi:ribosomal protein S18 acetylase RimI-like enzyme
MDSFRISFGEDPSKWPNNLGNLMENDYIEIIKKKLIGDASSVIHVWSCDEVVGQIESAIRKDDPKCGYVSLYYLIPNKRGLGFGSRLDDFVTRRFSELHCERIELVVEKSNIIARSFYQKQGWINKGLHPSYEDGILMEKLLIR